MIHVPSRVAVDARGMSWCRASAGVHLVPDRSRLPRVAARRDHEVVGERAHGPHVEDDDVLRQLLLGESGDAAGLFEGGQSRSVSLLGVLSQCSPGSWTVEPAFLDQARRPREERTGRAAAGGARERSSVEEPDSARCRRKGRARAGRVARAPRRAGRVGSRAVSRPRGGRARVPRPAPSRRGRSELVGADHEDGVVEALGAQQVDRARVAVEPHIVAGKAARASSSRSSADACTSRCAGRSLTRTTSRSTPKRSLAASATATWPRCGGSNAPP